MTDRHRHRFPPMTPWAIVREILCWAVLLGFIWLVVKCSQGVSP